MSVVHDGDGEIAEYDGAGALIRRFVPGPAVDDHIAQVTAGGVKTFFHTDKMGSTIAMSDMSGVLVEGPYVYDAYGTCLSGGANCLTLPATTQPFRFTGQRLDPETGLYYYRARYYISSFGRFAQTDPVGYKDDLNPYSYVGNDPANGTDPSGLCMPVACKGGDSFGGIEGCNAANGGCGGGWGSGTHDQREAVRAVLGNPNGYVIASSSLPVAMAGIGHNGGPPLGPSWLRIFGRAFGVIGAILSVFEPAGDPNEEAFVRGIGSLRDAARGKGSFGIGSATARESNIWGEAWVGPGYRVASDGSTLVSANGLRTYRPPSYKPKLDKMQSNFEQKWTPTGQPYSNAHLDITGP